MSRMERQNGDGWKPRKNRKKQKEKKRGRANRPAPLSSVPAASVEAIEPTAAAEALKPPIESAEPPQTATETPPEVHAHHDAHNEPRTEKPSTLPTIDYIPMGLFALFSVCSAGLYPYIWLLNRIDGFAAIGATGLDRSGLGRYCVFGICAQLLPLASLVVCLWAHFAGVGEWYASAFLMLAAYGAAIVLVILPMRCFYHFDIRWRLRRAASRWDENGLMIARTAPSLLRLFLFGTAYLQAHVNRLIGLGMPGFTGYDDVGTDATVGDAIKDYVRGAMRRE